VPDADAPVDRVTERRRAAALARHYRDAGQVLIAKIARRLGRAAATVKATSTTRPASKAEAVMAREPRLVPHLRCGPSPRMARAKPTCDREAALLLHSLPEPG
jgi:hypothetical protein